MAINDDKYIINEKSDGKEIAIDYRIDYSKKSQFKDDASDDNNTYSDLYKNFSLGTEENIKTLSEKSNCTYSREINEKILDNNLNDTLDIYRIENEFLNDTYQFDNLNRHLGFGYLYQVYSPEENNLIDLYKILIAKPNKIKDGITKLNILGGIFHVAKKAKKDTREETQKTLIEALKQKYDLDDKDCEIIISLANPIALGRLLKAKKDTKLTTKEFLRIFSNKESAKTYQKNKLTELGLTDSFVDFEGKYTVIPERLLNSGVEEANKELYKQGIDMLRGILEGRIAYEIKDEQTEVMLKTKNALTEKIREAAKEKKDIKALVEEKKRIEAALKIYEREKIIKMLPDHNPNEDELKDTLIQLSQHALTGKSKDRAEHISKSIRITDEGTYENIEISVWSKTLKEAPTYDDFHCCAFDEQTEHDEELSQYMASANLQILNIKAGDKKAAAITFATKDKTGKKALIVDSVETGTHMFSRRDVAIATSKGIEDYARKAGFDYVVYSTNAGNNGPQEFVANLPGEESNTNLDAFGSGLFLEFRGYGKMVKLSENQVSTT